MNRTLAGCFVLAAALGCGTKKQGGPPTGEASSGSATATAKAGDKVLATFGAKGGNVYAEQLIARDDGGYVLNADVLGSVRFGGTTIKGAIKGFAIVGARPLVLDTKGRLLVELSVNSPLDFGGGLVSPTGTGDAIVLAFDKTGKYVGQSLLQAPGEDNSGGLAVGKDGMPVAAWIQQRGPAGQAYEEWAIADVYYASVIQQASP